jgi:hypothetical protein
MSARRGHNVRSSFSDQSVSGRDAAQASRTSRAGVIKKVDRLRNDTAIWRSRKRETRAIGFFSSNCRLGSTTSDCRSALRIPHQSVSERDKWRWFMNRRNRFKPRLYTDLRGFDTKREANFPSRTSWVRIPSPAVLGRRRTRVTQRARGVAGVLIIDAAAGCKPVSRDGGRCAEVAHPQSRSPRGRRDRWSHTAGLQLRFHTDPDGRGRVRNWCSIR